MPRMCTAVCFVAWESGNTRAFRRLRLDKGADAAASLQAKALTELNDELASHARLASTFDFAEAATEARNRIKDIKDELVMAKDVWDTVLLCDRQFSEWKKTLWSDINTEAMEDASKAFVKEVRAAASGSPTAWPSTPHNALDTLLHSRLISTCDLTDAEQHSVAAAVINRQRSQHQR